MRMSDELQRKLEHALLGGPRRYTRLEVAAKSGVSPERVRRVVAGPRVRLGRRRRGRLHRRGRRGGPHRRPACGRRPARSGPGDVGGQGRGAAHVPLGRMAVATVALADRRQPASGRAARTVGRTRRTVTAPARPPPRLRLATASGGVLRTGPGRLARTAGVPSPGRRFRRHGGLHAHGAPIRRGRTERRAGAVRVPGHGSGRRTPRPCRQAHR